MERIDRIRRGINILNKLVIDETNRKLVLQMLDDLESIEREIDLPAMPELANDTTRLSDNAMSIALGMAMFEEMRADQKGAKRVIDIEELKKTETYKKLNKK